MGVEGVFVELWKELWFKDFYKVCRNDEVGFMGCGGGGDGDVLGIVIGVVGELNGEYWYWCFCGDFGGLVFVIYINGDYLCWVVVDSGIE